MYQATSSMCYSAWHVEDICKCQKNNKKLVSESHQMVHECHLLQKIEKNRKKNFDAQNGFKMILK